MELLLIITWYISINHWIHQDSPSFCIPSRPKKPPTAWASHGRRAFDPKWGIQAINEKGPAFTGTFDKLFFVPIFLPRNSKCCNGLGSLLWYTLIQFSFVRIIGGSNFLYRNPSKRKRSFDFRKMLGLCKRRSFLTNSSKTPVLQIQPPGYFPGWEARAKRGKCAMPWWWNHSLLLGLSKIKIEKHMRLYTEIDFSALIW